MEGIRLLAVTVCGCPKVRTAIMRFDAKPRASNGLPRESLLANLELGPLHRYLTATKPTAAPRSVALFDAEVLGSRISKSNVSYVSSSRHRNFEIFSAFSLCRQGKGTQCVDTSSCAHRPQFRSLRRPLPKDDLECRVARASGMESW